MSLCSDIAALFPGLICRDPNQCAPLVLAYVGDTIYDLYVRTLLVEQSDATPHGLHLMAAKLVRASAQAEAARYIAPTFSEPELAVFKRGRNAHLGTVPKNATIADYRAATGFEALLGYLYLKGEDARLKELMQTALSPREKALDNRKENPYDYI